MKKIKNHFKESIKNEIATFNPINFGVKLVMVAIICSLLSSCYSSRSGCPHQSKTYSGYRYRAY